MCGCRLKGGRPPIGQHKYLLGVSASFEEQFWYFKYKQLHLNPSTRVQGTGTPAMPHSGRLNNG
jgi:hypothetical protein